MDLRGAQRRGRRRALPGEEVDADDWAAEHEWEDGMPSVVYEVLEEAFDDDEEY